MNWLFLIRPIVGGRICHSDETSFLKMSCFFFNYVYPGMAMKEMGKVGNPSATNYEISWVKILISILKRRRFPLFFAEIRKRLYSDIVYYILRRDLTLPFPQPKTNISLTLRPIQGEDVPKLLSLEAPDLNNAEILERINLLRILKSDIHSCYVVATDDGIPCSMAWLILPAENNKIRHFFKGKILPLTPGEVLFEGVFTLEKYRKFGIQHWRRWQFFEKGVQLGAKWAVTYIHNSNIPSLKSVKRDGYEPYMVRKEKWRFFWRTFTFTKLPPQTPFPFDNV